MFAIALWDDARAAPAPGPRPLRDQAALLPARRRDALLRLGAEGDAGAAGVLARDRPAGDVAAYLAFNSIPAPLTIFAEARKLPPGLPAHLARRRDRRSGATRGPHARPTPSRCAPGRRASLPTSCARSCADSIRAHLVADVPVGVLLSGGVDSGGLTALAAAESGEPVKTFSIGFEEAGFDELVSRPPGRRALRHRPSRAGPAPRRGRAAAEAGRSLRRALRRLLGAADLPRLRARRRRGQGGALGGGRRRALRRLLHLRRRPAGAAVSVASRRSPRR